MSAIHYLYLSIFLHSTVLKEILNFRSTLRSQKRRPQLSQEVCKWSPSDKQKKTGKLLDIGHWQWRTENAKKAGINVDFLNFSHKIILPLLSSSLSTLSWVNDPTADSELKSPGWSFICISFFLTHNSKCALIRIHHMYHSFSWMTGFFFSKRKHYSKELFHLKAFCSKESWLSFQSYLLC